MVLVGAQALPWEARITFLPGAGEAEIRELREGIITFFSGANKARSMSTAHGIGRNGATLDISIESEVLVLRDLMENIEEAVQIKLKQNPRQGVRKYARLFTPRRIGELEQLCEACALPVDTSRLRQAFDAIEQAAESHVPPLNTHYVREEIRQSLPLLTDAIEALGKKELACEEAELLQDTRQLAHYAQAFAISLAADRQPHHPEL